MYMYILNKDKYQNLLAQKLSQKNIEMDLCHIN